MTESKEETAMTTEPECKPVPTPNVSDPDQEAVAVPAKPLATKQMRQRRRYPPRAPGFLPVPADTVLTMSLQLGLVTTDFLVIVTSFAYDGSGLGLIIFLEILFTYVGFAWFTIKMMNHVMVYNRFFKSLNEWYSRRYEALTDENNDNSCACCCIGFVLINVCWWVAALLMFPIIIFWSMKQSYNWYQDRRRAAHSEIDLTQYENVTAVDARSQYWKMTDTAYSVWHLGVLTKQAAMIVMFVQDIPLWVISLLIVNYIGMVVYPIVIVLKLLFWFKHMCDLGICTIFYKAEDYMLHFGIKEIVWTRVDGLEIIVAEYLSPHQHELSTLQVGDWVAWYDDNRTESTKMFMIVVESKHLKATEKNLVLVHFHKVDRQAIKDYEEGNAKKLQVPPEVDRYEVDRWGANIELLRNEEYAEYHDKYLNGENPPLRPVEMKEEEANEQVLHSEDVIVVQVVEQVPDNAEVKHDTEEPNNDTDAPNDSTDAPNDDTEAKDVSVAGNESGSVSGVDRGDSAKVSEDTVQNENGADDVVTDVNLEENQDKIDENEHEHEPAESGGEFQDGVIVNEAE